MLWDPFDPSIWILQSINTKTIYMSRMVFKIRYFIPSCGCKTARRLQINFTPLVFTSLCSLLCPHDICGIDSVRLQDWVVKEIVVLPYFSFNCRSYSNSLRVRSIWSITVASCQYSEPKQQIVSEDSILGIDPPATVKPLDDYNSRPGQPFSSNFMSTLELRQSISDAPDFLSTEIV